MISEDSGSISVPDHLYTWLDVHQYFTDLATHQRWPTWLCEVDAYWDSVRFLVAEGVDEEVFWGWLTEVLGSLTVSRDQRALLLEDAGTERLLPVECDVLTTPLTAPRRPRWTEQRAVAGVSGPLPPPRADRLPQDVAVAAFHSFKGGVGRTLHCVATARALAQAGVRVLLVGGDLEAPGITWMRLTRSGSISRSRTSWRSSTAPPTRSTPRRSVWGVSSLPTRSSTAWW